MSPDTLISIYRIALAVILTCTLVLLTGCQTTERVLSGLDYACVDVQVDGMATDSGAQGRGIKLPEGEALTPDLVQALCE
jgi:hypothetical protein